MRSGAGASDVVGQMVGAFATTAMVWQREYPLDTLYFDTLMTAATGLYGAGIRGVRNPKGLR